MSFVTVGKNGRIYPRKFDHDEARERYAAGESSSALAREYGVTQTAVWTVVSAKGAKWRDSERLKGAGRCRRCGDPTNAQSVYTHPRSKGLCTSCANDDQATSVRADELQCSVCRAWKPDEAFPHNHSERFRRRTRHGTCRRCLTAARQEYRERHKVPCVGRGKPALPPSEKRTNGSDVPRCRSCFNAAQRVQAGTEAPVQLSREKAV